MDKSIKVAFTDFWHGDSEDEIQANPIYRLLSRYYRLELSNNPDFLIYSCFGKKYLKYNCTRIFYTGENVRPNFDQCDYAFSFDYPVTERNYRLPLYFLYKKFSVLQETRENLKKIPNREFCSFVYSNKRARERIDFFHKLNQYKPVASGGSVLNNIGGRVRDKGKFLQSYKFSIAFENSSYPGYTTEKIMEALNAGAVPIYWGNPEVHRDFNPECFINCHDFDSFEAVVAHIEKVDKDDSLYQKYINAPLFSNGRDTEFINEENVRNRFDRIFSTSKESLVAKHIDKYIYLLHPSRPWYYARSLFRVWRRRHNS